MSFEESVKEMAEPFIRYWPYTVTLLIFVGGLFGIIYYYRKIENQPRPRAPLQYI